MRLYAINFVILFLSAFLGKVLAQNIELVESVDSIDLYSCDEAEEFALKVLDMIVEFDEYIHFIGVFDELEDSILDENVKNYIIARIADSFNIDPYQIDLESLYEDKVKKLVESYRPLDPIYYVLGRACADEYFKKNGRLPGVHLDSDKNPISFLFPPYELAVRAESEVKVVYLLLTDDPVDLRQGYRNTLSQEKDRLYLLEAIRSESLVFSLCKIYVLNQSIVLMVMGCFPNGLCMDAQICFRKG